MLVCIQMRESALNDYKHREEACALCFPVPLRLLSYASWEGVSTPELLLGSSTLVFEGAPQTREREREAGELSLLLGVTLIYHYL
jgi:hypothetical protein